jgi:hypothetical protein
MVGLLRTLTKTCRLNTLQIDIKSLQGRNHDGGIWTVGAFGYSWFLFKNPLERSPFLSHRTHNQINSQFPFVFPSYCRLASIDTHEVTLFATLDTIILLEIYI